MVAISKVLIRTVLTVLRTVLLFSLHMFSSLSHQSYEEGIVTISTSL